MSASTHFRTESSRLFPRDDLPPGTIITIAGGSPEPSRENGLPATQANLYRPSKVCGDGKGNLYLADAGNHCVRKISAEGMITVIAGTGEPGYSGDGGPATEAQIWSPQRICFDGQGCLYIADTGNHRVRRIDADGLISTIAGTGERGYSGDGGSALEAQLINPFGVAVDRRGNVFVSDHISHCIRKIDADGLISTIAGTGERGYSGDGGPAIKAMLNMPYGICLDDTDALYIADHLNNRIRRIGPDGIIETVAGTYDRSYWGDGGPATEAALNAPNDVWIDHRGRMFITEHRNKTLREVDEKGVITTLVGAGFGSRYAHLNPPPDESRADTSCMHFPVGLWSDDHGALYIAERERHCIRRIDASGAVKVIAGIGLPGYAGDGGPATEASLRLPSSVWGDGRGNLYIADSANHCIRRVNAKGVISTIAGTGDPGYSDDGGPAASAALNFPFCICGDGRGNLYIADSANHRIRKINNDGVITTIAGTGERGYAGDGGPATAARLCRPVWIAVDKHGRLYITNMVHHVIRRVSSDGVITTIAGTGERGYTGDGGPAVEAALNMPRSVCLDRSGNLYIADHCNQRVRKVDAEGVITTVAGDGTRAYAGDGRAATNTGFFFPHLVWGDKEDQLFIIEWTFHWIRKVDAAGITSTVAGGAVQRDYHAPPTGVEIASPCGVWGDEEGRVYVTDTGCHQAVQYESGKKPVTIAGRGDPSGEAEEPVENTRLYDPHRVCLDVNGHLIFAESSRYRLRKISPNGLIRTIAGHGAPGYCGDGGPAVEAAMAAPQGLAVDEKGRVFISDTDNNRIRRIDLNGVITTIAGTGQSNFNGDSGPATEINFRPEDLAFDPAGALLVTDAGHRIRRIDKKGLIRTIAGDGFRDERSRGRHRGDGGPAVEASLDGPTRIWCDESGRIYFVDSNNSRIRKIDADGIITTIAGNGKEGAAHDGDSAIQSPIGDKHAFCADNMGNVYFLDRSSHRIRKIGADSLITTIAGTGVIGSSGDGGPAARAQLQYPHDIYLDRFGNLYLSESSLGRIRMISRIAAPVIDIQTRQIDLGSTAAGRMSEMRTVVVRNPGFLPLTAVLSTLHADVSVAPDACILPPQSERRIRIWHAPSGAGDMDAMLEVRSNDPANPEMKIPVHGQGMVDQVMVHLQPVVAGPGTTAVTPVTIQTAGTVRGLQFRLRYDASHLEGVDFVKDTNLSGFSAIVSSYNDQTTVVIFTENGASLPAGDHLLGHLKLALKKEATPGSVLPMIIEQATVADEKQDDTTGGGSDSALLISDMLAGQDLRHLVRLSRLIRLLNAQVPAARPGDPAFDTLDANDDGLLDIADVVLLSARLQGRELMPDLDEPAAARVIPAMVRSGDQISPRVALQIESEQLIAGVQARWSWTPEHLQCGDPHTAGRATGMNLDYNESDGELRIIMYSPLGKRINPGSGAIMLLPVIRQLDPFVEPIICLASISLVTPQGMSVPTQIVCSALKAEFPPPSFHLGPNRPDPFTITTVITYDVPASARVTLDIAASDGKEPLRLLDTAAGPGRHTFIWDGKDAAGHPLPSGAYQCIMQTSTGFVQSRTVHIDRS